jgi:hypothetical protein
MSTSLTYPIIFDAFADETPGRASAVDELLATVRAAEPWDYDPIAQRELQLAAFNERLQQRAEQIPMVRQRAEMLETDKVTSFAEILPLLLSPNIYKSYPDSLVTNGKWSSLLRWLDGLSSVRVTDTVSVDGVADIDDFVDRLEAAGYPAVTTSGTSGKVSIIPETLRDNHRAGELWSRVWGRMWDITPDDGPHPLFYANNRDGVYRGIRGGQHLMRAFSSPELSHVLFEDRLRVSDISRMSALNKQLANGTATPSEISEIRANQAAAEQRAQAAFDRFLDLMASYPDRPIYLWGQTYAYYSIMKRARARGVSIDFYPGSGLVAGGGLKNNRLPDGWQDELRAFYDIPITAGYGQSEVIGLYLECEQGRWHLPPQVLLLLTDASGEQLVEPLEGIVEGVAASFDFSADGHWGGLLSSDWLTVDFDACPCGLRSPSVLDCRRHDPSGGDDKLNCQGRVEMYIRGILDEPGEPA